MKRQAAMALLIALVQLLSVGGSGEGGEVVRVGGGLEPSFTVAREGEKYHFITRILNTGPNTVRFFGGMDVVSGPSYMLTDEGELLFRAHKDSLAATSGDHRCLPPPGGFGRSGGAINVYVSWARSQFRIPWEKLEHELAPGQAVVDTMTHELEGTWRYRFPTRIVATCQFVALSDSIPGIAVLPEKFRGETFTAEVDLSSSWRRRE